VTQPGMTIVCVTRTPNPRRLRCLAFGIGTSEVEHVLATQTLPSKKLSPWRHTRGQRASGVSAKDIALASSDPRHRRRAGHVIEYRGEAIRDLSMEGRMTVCNMSIEPCARRPRRR